MSIELLNAMKAAALYDHKTSEFTLIETHISWVLLTGPFVYKIKKPVNLGFLDFSTLEKRKKFCELEVALNKRLASDLYEGVIPISGSPEAPKLNDNSAPFEYAIKMNQFSQACLFDTMHKNGLLEVDHLQDIAQQLARFHASIEPCKENSQYGTPEQVWAPVQQNFEQIKPLLTQEQDLKQLERLEQWANNEFKKHQPVIKERKKKGFIKACHGDVHLGNITLLNNQVTLFDCIEFNESFRWTDTMADLAFLVMDLEARQLNHFAAIVIDTYMEYSGDCCGLALLRFYKAYRALVRAKVALFGLYNDSLNEKDKQSIVKEYRQYANLAESYCSFKKPFLATMNGLSGSGKSTVSEYIVYTQQAIRLRSDVERKRLFGLKADESSQLIKEDIYNLNTNQKTYKKLEWLTRQLLESGYPVVVDSAALKEEERTLFYTLSRQISVPFIIIRCQAPDTELIRRIKKRQQNDSDASEATPDIIYQQHSWQDEITSKELPHTLTLDTSDKNWKLQLKERFLSLLATSVEPAF
ncbi:AAA family ATPase [Endozoicomonas sp. Mp262]|uniref:bifunctional aminoglycoside phosphotransferase/ATP-binding protein n=1 Tax=Endozoicomonas sp. Mp262 TaxID=2919499 RepID=UPI0021DA6037